MKIITHPQSRAYDEGWDAIFGKKRFQDAVTEFVAGHQELLTELAATDGVEASEQPVPEPESSAGVRRPRGWTPKNG